MVLAKKRAKCSQSVASHRSLVPRPVGSHACSGIRRCWQVVRKVVGEGAIGGMNVSAVSRNSQRALL